MVVAAARAAPVDVDIELVDPGVDHLRVGRMALDDDEQAALRSVPAGRRPGWFATIWARKEAVVKALGEGLRTPLRSFAVSRHRTYRPA